MGTVVLSRKGFDASAGGYPSPILPDGRMVSLPIPEAATGARYAELRTATGQTYADLMRAAGIRRVRCQAGWLPLDDRLEAHLDPDLSHGTRGRRPGGWRAAFGQAGAAQTILARAGVGPGALFLFFGWFRHLGVRPRRDLHVLWGWLRVGAVVDPRTGSHGHDDHPHVVRPQRANNTLYVAADEAFPGVPGAGTFIFDPSLVLTAPAARGRADWLLPACIRTATVLDRHRSRIAADGRFDARYQWQEFVAHGGADLDAWAEQLLRRAT